MTMHNYSSINQIYSTITTISITMTMMLTKRAFSRRRPRGPIPNSSSVPPTIDLSTPTMAMMIIMITMIHPTMTTNRRYSPPTISFPHYSTTTSLPPNTITTIMTTKRRATTPSSKSKNNVPKKPYEHPPWERSTPSSKLFLE